MARDQTVGKNHRARALLILEPLSERVAGQACSEMWDYVHCQWVGNGGVYGLLTHKVGKGVRVQYLPYSSQQAYYLE